MFETHHQLGPQLVFLPCQLYVVSPLGLSILRSPDAYDKVARLLPCTLGL